MEFAQGIQKINFNIIINIIIITTRQVSLQLVFSVQLAFHAFFTLTIVTMASFRSRLKKENTVPWPQQMNAILQLLSLPFS